MQAGICKHGVAGLGCVMLSYMLCVMLREIRNG
jgi:hypothetical protein